MTTEDMYWHLVLTTELRVVEIINVVDFANQKADHWEEEC